MMTDIFLFQISMNVTLIVHVTTMLFAMTRKAPLCVSAMMGS